MATAFLQDLRFALRQFVTRPGFTFTAVLILALGLGANTAIFSVVNVFLLRPLPYRQPDRLVALWERNVVGNSEKYNPVAPGAYYDWKKYSTSFEEIAAYFSGPVTIANRGDGVEPQRLDAAGTPANLLPTLGISPLLGRGFSAEEDRFGATRVAIIGYALWQNRFGGIPDIIGKTVRVDGLDCQIVGVMPRGFTFPTRTTQLWLPFATFFSPARQQRHDNHFLSVIGRLRRGVPMERAEAELDAMNARYKQAHPTEMAAKGATVTSLQNSLVRNVRSSLLILFGAVSCVLLIACVNVANLLLARASGRTREIAIRTAIGASRIRIVQQLLIESILLATAGGGIGVLFAVWITQFLALHAPGAESILTSGDVPVDTTVFLFTFAIALTTGIAAGLFPAIQSSRVDLSTGLKESSRSATSNRAQGRFRGILVAAEVALSLVLLIAAGLLLRSFSQVYQAKTGVRMDHTLTMTVPVLHKPTEQVATFQRDLPRELERVPGIAAAGLSSCLPLAGHCDDLVFYIEGRPSVAGEDLDALKREAGPGYFAAAGIPLLRGRTLTPQDGLGSDEQHPKLDAIVINAEMAKRFFPNEDPIGKRLQTESQLIRQKLQGIPAPTYQIVGVVGNVLAELDKSVEPTMYLPLLDAVDYDAVFVTVHTTADPHSVIPGIRQQIGRLDPDVAVDQIRTMDEMVGISTSDREFSMLLFGSFAALALILAAAGLYAVLSYTVSQRKAEIGIRLALGASKTDVGGWVLRQGLKPALAGVVAGLIVASMAAQVIKSLLFGIEPFDPLTFAVLPVLLMGIAALACYVPARRATRIDPTVALRME